MVSCGITSKFIQKCITLQLGPSGPSPITMQFSAPVSSGPVVFCSMFLHYNKVLPLLLPLPTDNNVSDL